MKNKKKKVPYHETSEYRTSIPGMFTGMFPDTAIYVIPSLLICWGWIGLCVWLGLEGFLMISVAAMLVAACYFGSLKIEEWKEKRYKKD